MREHKDEKELKELAEKYSNEVVIRTYDESGSHDERRKATKKESEILFNVIYGALLGLNWGEDNRSNKKCEQAICDTAEFIAMKFFPELNTYDSVYLPLKKIIEEWENEEV